MAAEEDDDQRKPTVLGIGLVFPMRDVAACAGDEAAGQPGCIPSADLCKSKSPTAEAPPRPVRRAEFYAGRARWVWMQVLQYRRGDRCSFEPGRCSRSLLGQSVTRQVGAAGRSIAPSSQVLPVIPMPGGERSWRTAATLFLLQLQFFGDCSLGRNKICSERVRS